MDNKKVQLSSDQTPANILLCRTQNRAARSWPRSPLRLTAGRQSDTESPGRTSKEKYFHLAIN